MSERIRELVRENVGLLSIQLEDEGDSPNLVSSFGEDILAGSGKLTTASLPESLPKRRVRMTAKDMPEHTIQDIIPPAYEFEGAQGRTLKYKDKKTGRYLALKLLKKNHGTSEDPSLLDYEGRMFDYLSRNKDKLRPHRGKERDRPVCPKPVLIEGRYVVRVKADEFGTGVRDAIKSQITKEGQTMDVDTEDGFYTLMVYETEDESYFTYLNNPNINKENFNKALLDNVHDLFILARYGIIDTAIIELFHNEIQKGRKDSGKYVWMEGVRPENARIGAGRLNAWPNAVRYPNTRLSGISDLPDIYHIDELAEEGHPASVHLNTLKGRHPKYDTSTFYLASYMGDYLLSMALVIGSYYRERNELDWQDDKKVEELAGLIKSYYIEAFMTFTGKPKEEADKYSEMVDWHRFALQMAFFMAKGDQYAGYLFPKGSLPKELYGKGVTIEYSHDYPGSRGWVDKDGKKGWYFDGENPDLGPVNGPNPLQELIKANYIFTAFMISENARSHAPPKAEVETPAVSPAPAAPAIQKAVTAPASVSNNEALIKRTFGMSTKELQELGFRTDELLGTLNGRPTTPAQSFGLKEPDYEVQEQLTRLKSVFKELIRKKHANKELIVYDIGLGLKLGKETVGPKEALDIIELIYEALADSGEDEKEWRVHFVGLDIREEVLESARGEFENIGKKHKGLTIVPVAADARKEDELTNVLNIQGKKKKADIIFNRYVHYGNRYIYRCMFDEHIFESSSNAAQHNRRQLQNRRQLLEVYSQIANLIKVFGSKDSFYVVEPVKGDPNIIMPSLVIPGADVQFDKYSGIYKIRDPNGMTSLGLFIDGIYNSVAARAPQAVPVAELAEVETPSVAAAGPAAVPPAKSDTEILRILNKHDIPPEIISIVRSMNFDEFDRWIRDITFGLKTFDKHVRADGRLLEILEKLALIFAYEQRSERLSVDSIESTVRNMRIEPKDREAIVNLFYAGENYSTGRTIESTEEYLMQLLNKALPDQKELVVFSRIKQFKSILLKLERIVRRTKALPAESPLSVPQLINEIKVLKSQISGARSDDLDDLIGFNILVNDIGLSQTGCDDAMRAYAVQVERNLERAGLKVTKVEKKGRVPGTISINIYVYGLLDHRDFGSLPIKVQFRPQSVMYGESSMYYEYKTTGVWSQPPWVSETDFRSLRSHREARRAIYDGFKKFAASAASPSFLLKDHLAIDNEDRSGAYDFFSGLPLYSTSSLTPSGYGAGVQTNYDNLHELIGSRFGANHRLSVAVLDAAEGAHLQQLDSMFKRAGYDNELVGTELIGALAKNDPRILHMDVSDQYDREKAAEGGKLVAGSQDVVAVDLIESRPDAVVKAGLGYLKPGGAMIVTFAESDIQTDYRSLPALIDDIAHREGCETAMVDLPEDYPKSLKQGVSVRRYNRMLVIFKPGEGKAPSAPVPAAPPVAGQAPATAATKSRVYMQEFNKKMASVPPSERNRFVLVDIVGGDGDFVDLNQAGLLMRGTSEENESISDLFRKGCELHSAVIGTGPNAPAEIPQVFMGINREGDLVNRNPGIDYGKVDNNEMSKNALCFTLIISDDVKKWPSFKLGNRIGKFGQEASVEEPIPPVHFKGVIVNKINLEKIKNILSDAGLNIPIYVVEGMPATSRLKLPSGAATLESAPAAPPVAAVKAGEEPPMGPMGGGEDLGTLARQFLTREQTLYEVEDIVNHMHNEGLLWATMKNFYNAVITTIVTSGRPITIKDLNLINAMIDHKYNVPLATYQFVLRKEDGGIDRVGMDGINDELLGEVEAMINGNRDITYRQLAPVIAVLNKCGVNWNDPAQFAWLMNFIVVFLQAYEEGNHRTGWALMNIIRMRHNLPPIQFKQEWSRGLKDPFEDPASFLKFKAEVERQLPKDAASASLGWPESGPTIEIVAAPAAPAAPPVAAAKAGEERDVRYLMHKYGAVFMHGVLKDFDTSSHPFVDFGTDWMTRIQILGYMPEVSTTTISKGNGHQLWAPVGAIINGGSVRLSYPHDAKTFITKDGKKKAYEHDAEKRDVRSIEQNILAKPNDINEFVIANPQIAGCYICLDAYTEEASPIFGSSDLIPMAEVYMKVKQAGLPLYAVKNGEIFATEFDAKSEQIIPVGKPLSLEDITAMHIDFKVVIEQARKDPQSAFARWAAIKEFAIGHKINIDVPFHTGHLIQDRQGKVVYKYVLGGQTLYVKQYPKEMSRQLEEEARLMKIAAEKELAPKCEFYKESNLMVMEAAEGQSLASIVEFGITMPISIDERKRAIMQAVRELHTLGIAHGELATEDMALDPANPSRFYKDHIYIYKKGDEVRAMFIDFGLAKEFTKALGDEETRCVLKALETLWPMIAQEPVAPTAPPVMGQAPGVEGIKPLTIQGAVYGYFDPRTGTIIIDIEKAVEQFGKIVPELKKADKRKVMVFVHAHEIFHALVDKNFVYQFEPEEEERLSDIFAKMVSGLSPPSKEDIGFFNESISKLSGETQNFLKKEKLSYYSEDFLLNIHRLGVKINNIESKPIDILPKGVKGMSEDLTKPRGEGEEKEERPEPQRVLSKDEETYLNTIQNTHGTRARRLVENAGLLDRVWGMVIRILAAIRERLRPGAVLNLIRVGLNAVLQPILELMQHFAGVRGFGGFLERLDPTANNFRGAVNLLFHARDLERQRDARIVTFTEHLQMAPDVVLRITETGGVELVQAQAGEGASDENNFLLWINQQIDDHLLNTINITQAGQFLPNNADDNTLVIFTFNRQNWMDEAAIDRIRANAQRYIAARYPGLANRVVFIPIDVRTEDVMNPALIARAREESRRDNRLEAAIRDYDLLERLNIIMLRGDIRRLNVGINPPDAFLRQLLDRFGDDIAGRERIIERFRNLGSEGAGMIIGRARNSINRKIKKGAEKENLTAVVDDFCGKKENAVSSYVVPTPRIIAGPPTAPDTQLKPQSDIPKPGVGTTEGYVNEAILNAYDRLTSDQITARQAAEMIIQAIMTMPDMLEGIINMPTAIGICDKAYTETRDERFNRVLAVLKLYKSSPEVDKNLSQNIRNIWSQAPPQPAPAEPAAGVSEIPGINSTKRVESWNGYAKIGDIWYTADEKIERVLKAAGKQVIMLKGLDITKQENGAVLFSILYNQATISMILRLQEIRRELGERFNEFAFVDVGAGTGILGITALMLGAKEAVFIEDFSEAEQLKKPGQVITKEDIKVVKEGMKAVFDENIGYAKRVFGEGRVVSMPGISIGNVSSNELPQSAVVVMLNMREFGRTLIPGLAGKLKNRKELCFLLAGQSEGHESYHDVTTEDEEGLRSAIKWMAPSDCYIKMTSEIPEGTRDFPVVEYNIVPKLASSAPVAELVRTLLSDNREVIIEEGYAKIGDIWFFNETGNGDIENELNKNGRITIRLRGLAIAKGEGLFKRMYNQPAIAVILTLQKLRSQIGEERFNDLTFVDAGAGFGILGITAARLGAKVIAVENNEELNLKRNMEKIRKEHGEDALKDFEERDIQLLYMDDKQLDQIAMARHNIDAVNSMPGLKHQIVLVGDKKGEPVDAASEEFLNRAISESLHGYIDFASFNMPGFGEGVARAMLKTGKDIRGLVFAGEAKSPPKASEYAEYGFSDLDVGREYNKFPVSVIVKSQPQASAAQLTPQAPPGAKVVQVLNITPRTPEKQGEVVCPAGEKPFNSYLDSGKNMLQALIDLLREIDTTMLRNLFGGKPCYSLIAGAVPTDENGRPMEGLPSLTQERQSAERFINPFGNINLYHTMGAEQAAKKIIDVLNKSPDRSRFYLALSESVLKSEKLRKALESYGKPAEKSVEQFLSEKAMIDIIVDQPKEKPVVYMMPYSKLTKLGLLRLGLSDLLKKGLNDKNREDYEKMVSLYARIMCLISNRPNDAEQVTKDLLTAAGENPFDFFKDYTFRIILPPITKIDFNGASEELKAMAEVWHSL